MTQPESHEGTLTARIGRTGYRVEIEASGHSLVSDEPVEVGGTNAGATPYDLVLAALGACTAMTLRMYADRKGWPLEHVRVVLTHDRDHASDCEHEGRCERIDAVIELKGELSDEQRSRLLEIADRCPVHKTLAGELHLESRLGQFED